jgi:hypothetical protein
MKTWTMIVVVAGLALAGWGCQSAGPVGAVTRQDALKVESLSKGPTETTVIETDPFATRNVVIVENPDGTRTTTDTPALGPDGKPVGQPGSMTVGSAGPSSNVVRINDGGVYQAGSGPAGQAIRLKQPDGTTIDAFSQTNLKAAKRETVSKDGSRTVEVTFDSDSATATRADADRIAAALPYFESLTAAQKEALLAAINRDEEIWRAALESAVPGLFDAIVKVVGG